MKSMTGVCRWVSAFVLGMVFFLPQVVRADAIMGLFNTGSVGGIGDADLNYPLTASPSPALGTAVLITPHDAWVDAPTGSNWIGISNGTVTDPVGLYTYELTFDLSDLVPSTAVITGDWATDNGAEIFLNGNSTGITKALRGFEALAGFTIASGFQSGWNTLSFQVTNASGTSGNPTGLLVTNLAGTATAVPVPGAIWMGLGLIGMIFMGRTLPRK